MTPYERRKIREIAKRMLVKPYPSDRFVFLPDGEAHMVFKGGSAPVSLLEQLFLQRKARNLMLSRGVKSLRVYAYSHFAPPWRPATPDNSWFVGHWFRAELEEGVR